MKTTTINMICLLVMALILFSVNNLFAQDMFDTKVDYAVGYGPNSVFSTDFNGDGYYDLAAGLYLSDSVSILLGNGDGTFQSAVSYTAGDGPESVFSVDINGDGDNDLAIANNRSDKCRQIQCPNPFQYSSEQRRHRIHEQWIFRMCGEYREL